MLHSFPVVALDYLIRSALLKVRGKLLQAVKTGKLVLGVIMIGLASMILSGADKPLESWLVNHSPDWLTHLTTPF